MDLYTLLYKFRTDTKKGRAWKSLPTLALKFTYPVPGRWGGVGWGKEESAYRLRKLRMGWRLVVSQKLRDAYSPHPCPASLYLRDSCGQKDGQLCANPGSNYMPSVKLPRMGPASVGSRGGALCGEACLQAARGTQRVSFQELLWRFPSTASWLSLKTKCDFECGAYSGCTVSRVAKSRCTWRKLHTQNGR